METISKSILLTKKTQESEKDASVVLLMFEGMLMTAFDD